MSVRDPAQGSAPVGDRGVAGAPRRRTTGVPPGRPIDGPAAAEAVAGAFSAYHAEVAAYLRRLTHEAEVAEDLAQEAFLRLQREIQRGRAPDNPRAWLYRVAGNLAISRGRHVAVVRRRLAVTWPAAGIDDSPEREVLRQERDSGLDGVLADLPRDARLGLMLAAQGFSGREIATALGRSEVATRTMLCRARLRLRARLMAEELVDDGW